MTERKINWLVLSGLTVAGAGIVVGMNLFYPREFFSSEDLKPEPTAEIYEQPVYPHHIAPGSSLFITLRELEVSPATIHAIVQSTKPVFDLSRLAAGTPFRLIQTNQEVTALEFLLSSTEKLIVRNTNGTWAAEKLREKVETRIVTFRGMVKSTLWESAAEANMHPDLIVQLAEIFGWQVDFAREVRVNDRWRLSVEQKMVRGDVVGWGAILAAEYENAGQKHDAVLFKHGDQTGYFGSDGSNLRRMFLKSPIKFGRISSRFNLRRFHPVLKTRRPHLGTDYAAPTGTPIRSVGDGVVTLAAWHGGGGKTIKIRHNASYATAYLHLSRFAEGVKSGARVKQGQIIGYVGSTGLSTGPHLHFEFAHNGRVMDPLRVSFPSSDPIPAGAMASFTPHAQQQLSALPTWDGLAISARDSSSESPARMRAAGGRLVE